MSVATRFETFLSNIALTPAQKDAGTERRESVVERLNSNYWNSSSKTNNSIFVGSWAKQTRIRPPRDVDVLFKLPWSVYTRFEGRTGNKQSQLLQEVKGVLAAKFGATAIKGDGPVVIIPFTSYSVELIPAFAFDDGRYYISMTDNGGRYKSADYHAEETYIKDSDTATKGNTRELIRMMKAWQGYCSVPIKSFWLEIIAAEFLSSWEHKGKSRMWYDWMVRDFLAHLKGRRFGTIYAPGTYESMPLGEAWYSKASMAYDRAKKACELEATDAPAAGDEWQKIFGTDIPKYP